MSVSYSAKGLVAGVAAGGGLTQTVCGVTAGTGAVPGPTQYGVGLGEGSWANAAAIRREQSMIRPCRMARLSRLLSSSVRSPTNVSTSEVSQIPPYGTIAPVSAGCAAGDAFDVL